MSKQPERLPTTAQKSPLISFDKENGNNLPRSGSHGKKAPLLAATSRSTGSTSLLLGQLHRGAGLRPSPLMERRPLGDSSLLSWTTSPSLAPSHRRRSFLRLGETVENVFGLGDTSSEEQWKIARKVVNGESADDPKLWKRLLDLTKASSNLTGKPTMYILTASQSVCPLAWILTSS